MATKAEINTVYAAGLVQGIALVTFPAASTIFTSPSQYGLSNTQYGFLFLPQVVTAITTSVLGGSLAARFGTKRVFLAGLAADLASMALLIVSVFFTSSQPVAYGLLLAATACLGAGFGLTAPVINTLTAAFHPGRADASVLVLNALLGLGTTLAPVFVAIFVGLGFWWGLPVTSSVLLLALIAVSAGLPLRAGAPGAAPGRRTAMFVVIALLPTRTPALGIVAFALAGLGCSALLPLTISFAQEQLAVIGASVAGGDRLLPARLRHRGVRDRALVDAGVGLRLFGFAAIAAVIMGGLSFVLARRAPQPRCSAAPPGTTAGVTRTDPGTSGPASCMPNRDRHSYGARSALTTIGGMLATFPRGRCVRGRRPGRCRQSPGPRGLQ